MFTLGCGVWDKSLFQNLSVIRKSPTKGQFCCFLQILENQLCQPPTVQENSFDMPFLISHAGVIHRESKLDKSNIQYFKHDFKRPSQLKDRLTLQFVEEKRIEKYYP